MDDKQDILDQPIKIVVLDFDGVLHSYTSGWGGYSTIADPPVEGAMGALHQYAHDPTIEVNILSSRSKKPEGLRSMQRWLQRQLGESFEPGEAAFIYSRIQWPTEKPAAWLLIDDRAHQFTGMFPTVDQIKEFKPWYK